MKPIEMHKRKLSMEGEKVCDKKIEEKTFLIKSNHNTMPSWKFGQTGFAFQAIAIAIAIL